MNLHRHSKLGMVATESALAPAVREMAMVRETQSEYHARRAREEREEASVHSGEIVERRHALLAVGHEVLAKEFSAATPSKPQEESPDKKGDEDSKDSDDLPDDLDDLGNFA